MKTMNCHSARNVAQSQNLPPSARTPAVSAWKALRQGSKATLAHWRVLLLWWLAGLAPAAWLTRQFARAADEVFAYHPEAARIIAEPDIALLWDALLSHEEALVQLGAGLFLPLLLAGLLAPWAAGVSVASLRAVKPPGLFMLAIGGLREYFRQVRLYLLLVPPLGMALGFSFIALVVVELAASEVIVYSDIVPWRYAVFGFSALLILPTLGSIEAARAVLAADPAERSALQATSKGWQLVFKRFIAWLIISLLTWAAALVACLALQGIGQLGNSSWLALGMAQLAVIAMGLSRLVRLNVLQLLLPKPRNGR